jgi:hypothetical protein
VKDLIIDARRTPSSAVVEGTIAPFAEADEG